MTSLDLWLLYEQLADIIINLPPLHLSALCLLREHSPDNDALVSV